ncbi:MAG: hypothetical protein ACO3LE_09755, partial [Bdellovibrionota bacterium]
LAAILVASLAGSFVLRKSNLLLDFSNMNYRQTDIKSRVANEFNRIAQDFSFYLEQKLLAGGPASDLLNYQCSSNNPICFDTSTLSARGANLSIRCRGEGEGQDFNSTQCTTSQKFPKDFFLELQMRSLENTGEIVTAAGEIRVEPLPLNAYALALSNIDEVIRFGPGLYDGNIALNFSEPDAQAIFKPVPGPNGRVSISKAIVTNELSKIKFEGLSSGDSNISYAGAKQLPNLSGFLSAFEDGILRAMEAAGSKVFEFPEDITSLPAMTWPETLPNGQFDLEPNDDNLYELPCDGGETCFYQSLVALGARNCSYQNVRFAVQTDELETRFYVLGDRICGWDAVEKIFFVADGYNEFASHALSGGVFEGFEHDRCFTETDASAPYEFGCSGPQTQGQFQDAYCVRQVCQVSKIDSFIFGGSVGEGSNDFNLFHFPGVYTLSFVSLVDEPASSNQPFDVYVSEGRVQLLSPFSWQGDSTELGASFFAENGFHLGLETRSDDSESYLSESVLNAPLDFTFEGSLISLNEDLPTLNLSALLNADKILGKLSLKGGRIGAKPSVIRYFNANEVTRGFKDVEYIYLPNMSPALKERVFVANLGVTVLNFHIHYSNAKEALREVGLDWQEPENDQINSQGPAPSVNPGQQGLV